MTTVAFPTADDFVIWHDARCAAEGIPHPGYVADSTTPALANAWTTAYVTPQQIDGRCCVTLADADVANDPTLATLEVVTITLDADGKPDAEIVTPAPGVPYVQQIPPTWTDDEGTAWSVPEEARNQ